MKERRGVDDSRSFLGSGKRATGPLYVISAQNVMHPSANLGFCSGGRAVSNASCAEKCGTLVLSKSLSAGEFG